MEYRIPGLSEGGCMFLSWSTACMGGVTLSGFTLLWRNIFHRVREKNNESIKLGHRTALLTSTANVVCVITEALLKLGGRHSNYLITGGLGKVILMHKLYPSRGNIGAAEQENVLLKTTQNWSKFKNHTRG